MGKRVVAGGSVGLALFVLGCTSDRAFQGSDHPVPAAFGEGLYLKAVVARVAPR